MNDQFAKMIRKMENEITSLKTAHERGLGAVDFYSKTNSQTVDFEGYKRFVITATVADGQIVPAMIQLHFSCKVLILVSASQSSNQTIWDYWLYAKTHGQQTLTITAISSSQLSSLTVEAV